MSDGGFSVSRRVQGSKPKLFFGQEAMYIANVDAVVTKCSSISIISTSLMIMERANIT